MANIALKKLPLEYEDWINPEIATDGNFIGYTGTTGFASATWPCSYTIDLGTPVQIRSVRFLIWDNLGESKPKADKRKYKFSLSITSDGMNYQQIFSNKNDDGGNGWYTFFFLNDTITRFIKLEGHYNSANEMFHLVEFEIHDTEPNPLLSSNEHSFDIVTGIPGEDRINELIDIAISSKSAVFNGLDEKIRTIDNTLNASATLIKQIELVRQSIDFQRESINNISRSYWWLGSFFLSTLSFIGLLYWLIFHDSHSIKIIKDASKDPAIVNFTPFLLSAFYFTKALLLSVLVYIITWLLKNYRSERHNYVINKHKAMSLTVAITILTGDQYDNTSKGHVFLDAMKIVFAHQATGFSSDETPAPNIVNTLLSKES